MPLFSAEIDSPQRLLLSLKLYSTLSKFIHVEIEETLTIVTTAGVYSTCRIPFEYLFSVYDLHSKFVGFKISTKEFASALSRTVESVSTLLLVTEECLVLRFQLPVESGAAQVESLIKIDRITDRIEEPKIENPQCDLVIPQSLIRRMHNPYTEFWELEMRENELYVRSFDYGGGVEYVYNSPTVLEGEKQNSTYCIGKRDAEKLANFLIVSPTRIVLSFVAYRVLVFYFYEEAAIHSAVIPVYLP